MERVVDPLTKKPSALRAQSETIGFVVMVAALVVAPFVTYPLFLMQAMCFALFACAFNLLIGYVGLAVVRPRAIFRLGKLSVGPCRQRSGVFRRNLRS